MAKDFGKFTRFLVIWIEKNKETLKKIFEGIKMVVALATIFSIAFAVYVYYIEKGEQERIKIENNNIIIENSKKEIEDNLEITSYLQGDEFKGKRYFYWKRFNYFFLEKSLIIIKNKELRENILTTISDMKQINSVMCKDIWRFLPGFGRILVYVYTYV